MRRKLLGYVLGLAAAVLLLWAASTAAAQDDSFQLPEGVTWDDVNRIASKMYCDVCEGIPLDECESVACRQWREEIARQLGDGRTDDEIFDYFVERFGADVAAVPRDTSDRILAFAVPIALVLLFGAVGAVQVQRMRERGRQVGQATRRSASRLQARPVPEDVDPDYLERLERELEGFVES